MDCPIDRYTLKEIPDLLGFCREKGILPYFEAYINHGQSKKTQQNHGISKSELSDLFLQLQNMDSKFGINTELKPKMRIYVADKCLKPEYGFAVKANGEVRTCPTDSKKTIGNIREKPLAEILSPFNERYRQLFGKFGCSAVYSACDECSSCED